MDQIVNNNKKVYVLAYDWERTGDPMACRSIGLGMSVVDSDFKEVDTLLVPFYKPNEAFFEWRCVEEFWLGEELKELKARRAYDEFIKAHPDEPVPVNLLYRASSMPPSEVLNRLHILTTQRTQEEAESFAVDAFIGIIQKWERRAKAEGAILMRCSDNVPSDTRVANQLMAKYRPEILPLPYLLSEENNYGRHYDVHQMQIGFLASVYPDFPTKYWGATKAMEQLFQVPPKVKEHNHMPDSDAYTIAFDLQVVVNAARGTLPRR